MNFQEDKEDKLKGIWARSDAYFQFRYTEFKTFGSRLRKWRELNNLSLKNMAEAIYYYREKFGLESNNISEQPVPPESTDNIPDDNMVRDDQFDTIRKKRIDNLLHTYHEWETKKNNSLFSDTPFSMTNLRILKQILRCDYEFLFCEIDTPHKHTDELSDQIGLNTSTIEKLLIYDKTYKPNADSSSSAEYAHLILTALNKLISDDDLMTYLSYYLTSPSDILDENDNIKNDNFNAVSITHTFSGIPISDDYTRARTTTDNLSFLSVHLAYCATIANKLCHLRDMKYPENIPYPANLPSFNQVLLAEDNDSFGDRLRKWRTYKHYTQDNVADLIYSYRKEHHITKTIKGIPYIIEKSSILRTYQNWESKQNTGQNIRNTRLSMSDLSTLKHIMKCDYEYLFGEINTLTVPQSFVYGSLGLSVNNIKKLKKYTQSITENVPDAPAYANNILSSINLIVSNDTLLCNLAYFFSDSPFTVEMGPCPILMPPKLYSYSIFKEAGLLTRIVNSPIAPSQDAYSDYLFPDNKEMRNIFLPAIFRDLIILKLEYEVNSRPLPSETIDAFSNFITEFKNIL